jgi:hypothetical protein
MDCQKCKTNLLLDHMKKIGDAEQYYYVCINKRCTEYMKAVNFLSGEVTEPKINPAKE